MKPTLSIIHDVRRAKKSGKYPVKLRVTYFREPRYYPIGIDLTVEEFSMVHNPVLVTKKIDPETKKRLKEWKLQCEAYSVKAAEIVDSLGDFSFRNFEKRFFGINKTVRDVYQWYTTVIDKKRNAGRVGTASNYQSSMNSLKGFSPKLTFSDITVDFLNEYQNWLLSNGKSITTVGIYLRPLRAIMTRAIEEGAMSKEGYPFGKRRYQIPTGKNIKKALAGEEIGRIFKYDGIPGTWWPRARDFFIFSYLANGMNMKDIALLRNENIDGDYIRYSRAKTQGTNHSGNKLISVHISSELLLIIERWRSPKRKPEDLIFDILQENLTPDRERSLIQQFTKMVNKYIGKIAKSVGIHKPITTYYARHSFATILRRRGKSTELISESLGHTSVKTTANYLDSFDDETKKDIQAILMDF
jgi:integrase/recombinase XerD